MVNESVFGGKLGFFIPFLQRFAFKKTKGLMVIPTNVKFNMNNGEARMVEQIFNRIKHEYKYLIIKE